MNALRIGSTLFIFILAGHFALAAGSADDLARMKGRWKVTSAIMEGEPAKAEETGSLIVVIEAGRLTIESDGHNRAAKIGDEKVRHELLDSMDKARQPNPTSAVRP